MTALTPEHLGFAANECVVIIHGDDLGMCHAANTAFADIVAAGVVACGSVMVPCPWFPELAAFARAHPDADVGVHLTLTSEWHGYRWGPISTRERGSGLLDDEGYLWRDIGPLNAHVDARAGAAEMRAQVERALEVGIDVTHIDTHMGSVLHPELVHAYVALGLEFDLPVMLPRLRYEALRAWGVPAAAANEIAAAVDEVDAGGRFFIFEGFTSLADDVAMADPMRGYRGLLASLPAGLTHLIYHASSNSGELHAIMDESAAARRVVDWRVMSDPAFATVLAETGVRCIGYRALRDAMRRHGR